MPREGDNGARMRRTAALLLASLALGQEGDEPAQSRLDEANRKAAADVRRTFAREGVMLTTQMKGLRKEDLIVVGGLFDFVQEVLTAHKIEARVRRRFIEGLLQMDESGLYSLLGFPGHLRVLPQALRLGFGRREARERLLEAHRRLSEAGKTPTEEDVVHEALRRSVPRNARTVPAA